MTTGAAPGKIPGSCRSDSLADGREREIQNQVLSFLQRSERFREAALAGGTPLYIFEPEVMRERIRTFVDAFNHHLDSFEAFFAMKCNHHPEVVSTAVHSGLGLDVSSGIELSAAIEAGCRRILFSGPGKTDVELEMAAAHADRVTVLLDSFGELERLKAAASKEGVTVAAGVRVTTREEGLWRKFGIPLASLGAFLKTAAGNTRVKVQGLQFHTSWNLTPENQVDFIGRLGRELGSLEPGILGSLLFLDIGGGYWPEGGEWLLRSDTSVRPGTTPLRGIEHYRAAPIEDFAREVARALRQSVFTHVPLRIYAEPGRWIADKVMHILISVVDRKGDDLVVTDAGTNILGWERYETDYVPVINLSRPSLAEQPCLIAGSLCTPHDVWGWSYFGEGIEPGDILLLPNQGAYTWSLRQEFIKPVAEVITIND